MLQRTTNRRSIWVALATVWFTSLAALPAAAATIYVNNQLGNDQFGGHSVGLTGRNAGPVQTISRAMKIANFGDRVVIANTGQPYYENVALFGGRNSGSKQSPFRVESDGAVIDGTVPVSESAWENVDGALFRFRPERLAPQVLYHEGKPLEQVHAAAESIARPRIKPRQWCYHDGHVYFRVEAGMIPDKYGLRYAGHGAGLLLYRVEHVEISGLIVQGFQFDGVQAKDLVNDIRLVGLNLRGNGRSGIAVSGASRIAATDCLIGNNGQAQVRLEDYCRASLDNCDVLDNTAKPFVVLGGQLTVDGKPFDPRTAAK